MTLNYFTTLHTELYISIENSKKIDIKIYTLLSTHSYIYVQLSKIQKMLELM